jgi:hypothetical protein
VLDGGEIDNCHRKIGVPETSIKALCSIYYVCSACNYKGDITVLSQCCPSVVVMLLWCCRYALGTLMILCDAVKEPYTEKVKSS